MEATNILATQGTSVLLIPVFLQMLKQSKRIPWLTDESARLNRTVAWVVGIATAAGIHISGEYSHVTGDFVAQFTGNIFHALAVVGGQLGGQEFVYSHMQTLDSVREASKRIADVLDYLKAFNGPKGP
jgi:hypothetical protein